jgi:preprotein translocase subunit SecD
MTNRNNRFLIPILLLIAVSIWVALPNNPGIHIGSFNRDLPVRLGLDLVGGVQALLEADLPAGTTVDPESMQTARTIVENRVNGLGVTESVVQLAGDRRIVVELPGETDPQKALGALKQTGLLEFVELTGLSDQEIYTMENSQAVIQTDFGGSSGVITPTASLTTSVPLTPTAQVTTTATLTPTASLTSTTQLTSTAALTPTAPLTATAAVTPTEPTRTFHTVMTGSALKTVNVTKDQIGKYQVAFELQSGPDGADLFRTYTSAHVGKILAIVLDKKIISAPRIENAITDGKGVINGNFTYETANQLAVQLRYGSLPIPLKVVTSQTVGPTLGQDSLRKSLIAGFIGLAVVMIYMCLYYRLPGLIAALALLSYSLFSLTLFKFIPVTLTLPGIAGFVLSIGMAVDANVLIFERLKEELRAGRSLQAAIDLAWGRAWPSIRDSNSSTLITCLILFWFGSTFGASIVKGFSLTLAIGVVVSMFTAIIVTRTFLHTILDRIAFTEHTSWFGAV